MQNKISLFFPWSKGGRGLHGVHVWIDYKSGCMNTRSLLLFGHAALALINTPIKRRLEQRRGKDPPKVCNMSTSSVYTRKSKKLISNKDILGCGYALSKEVVWLDGLCKLCELLCCIDTIVAIQSDNVTLWGMLG